MFIGILTIITGFLCVFLYNEKIVKSLDPLLSGDWGVLPHLYIAMIITLVFHEIGHAGACIHSGAKVSKMGLVLFYFTPALYCDVSDVYMLGKSRAKLKVSVAGVYVNILFGSISLIIACVGDLSGAIATFFIVYYIANVGFVIYNLIPFVKLDGYWILASLLNINNLMNKSVLLFYSLLFDNKLFRRLKISISKRILLSIYGLGCIIARPLFWSIALIEIYSYINPTLDGTVTIGILCIILIGILYDLINSINSYRKLFVNERAGYLAKM